MRGSSRSRNLPYFGRGLGFLGTLWVERFDSLDPLPQLRNGDSETIGNEDALQDGEGGRGDREHQSKRTRASEVFVVERILDGSQVPGIVTSDHVDEDDAKGPDVGVERRVRDKLAVFIEALLSGLSGRG